MLAALESEGVKVCPSSATIAVIQDKYLQKVHLAGARVALPDFLEAPTLASLAVVSEAFGYPFMLKSRTGVSTRDLCHGFQNKMRVTLEIDEIVPLELVGVRRERKLCGEEG